MAEVFIAYSRADSVEADKIVEALQSMAVSCFVDQAGLGPNQSWPATLNEELLKAKSVLALWSENAAKSDQVVGEAEKGRSQKKLVTSQIREFDADLIPPALWAMQRADLKKFLTLEHPKRLGDPHFLKVVKSLGALIQRPGLHFLAEALSLSDKDRLLDWARQFNTDPYSTSIIAAEKAERRKSHTAEIKNRESQAKDYSDRLAEEMEKEKKNRIDSINNWLKESNRAFENWIESIHLTDNIEHPQYPDFPVFEIVRGDDKLDRAFAQLEAEKIRAAKELKIERDKNSEIISIRDAELSIIKRELQSKNEELESLKKEMARFEEDTLDREKKKNRLVEELTAEKEKYRLSEEKHLITIENNKKERDEEVNRLKERVGELELRTTSNDDVHKIRIEQLQNEITEAKKLYEANDREKSHKIVVLEGKVTDQDRELAKFRATEAPLGITSGVDESGRPNSNGSNMALENGARSRSFWPAFFITTAFFAGTGFSFLAFSAGNKSKGTVAGHAHDNTQVTAAPPPAAGAQGSGARKLGPAPGPRDASARPTVEIVAAPIAQPESGPGCSGCPDMVVLPGGELPDRTGVKAFSISKSEVTYAQYRDFLQSTGRRLSTQCQLRIGNDRPEPYDGSKVSPQDPRFTRLDQNWIVIRKTDLANVPNLFGDDKPMVCVSHADAVEYAKWLSARTKQTYRLPTRAEWEYAARGGTEEISPWSSTCNSSASPKTCRTCDDANLGDSKAEMAELIAEGRGFECDDKAARASVINSYRANRFGLHDMFGNVAELLNDCRAPKNNKVESEVAAGSGYVCPTKGGSWIGDLSKARVDDEGVVSPSMQIEIVGFRVVREDS